jgi:hypothetical protein
MIEKPSALEQISLVARNYGDGIVLEQVLLDWCDFLGGKPGEVVIVDAGSDRQTQEVYWNLYQQGLIDKLQIIKNDHEDHNFERGYIQIHTAGAIASKPYLLWFNVDTLPYRQGHEGWLEEAVGYLERDDTFAVAGAFNLPCKVRDAWDGWYFSRKCGLNFALMKRKDYLSAMYEYARDYIASGFTGENPAAANNQSRYLPEVAIEDYIERHQLYTLFRIEEPTWTVFHTNVHEERLLAARERYQARRSIKPYMNTAYSDESPEPWKALYYGQPQSRRNRFIIQNRVAWGNSILGRYWRGLKQKIWAKA